MHPLEWGENNIPVTSLHLTNQSKVPAISGIQTHYYVSEPGTRTPDTRNRMPPAHRKFLRSAWLDAQKNCGGWHLCQIGNWATVRKAGRCVPSSGRWTARHLRPASGPSAVGRHRWNRQRRARATSPQAKKQTGLAAKHRDFSFRSFLSDSSRKARRKETWRHLKPRKPLPVLHSRHFGRTIACRRSFLLLGTAGARA